jgi:radical SAM family RiPP maturation amino acid epimerase
MTAGVMARDDAAGSVTVRCVDDLELRRRLGLIKRFDERFRGDAGFRDAVVSDPATAAASIGVREDPRDLVALVTGAAVSDGFGLYHELAAELAAHRSRAVAPADDRFRAWRDAQIARCDLQLSRSRNEIIFHGPLVFELSVGCSVGCWFCGAGAEKLSAHVRHTEDHARLWRETLDAMQSVMGLPAARELFCYWATDPLDNPDYELFCADVVSVLGVCPPTTTALALKNVERTKRVLVESERHGGRADRFSILTLPMLDRVHREFTPEELLFVRLVLQNPEADTFKSMEGRFLAAARKDATLLEHELAKLRSMTADDTDPDDVVLPESTSCVTGFLVNMVTRTVQLVTPCPASERWPTGSYVYDEARFETASDLERILERMIARHMTTGAPRHARAHLLPTLAYEELPDGFRVTSRTEELEFRDDELGSCLRALGTELRVGDKTPAALAEWGAARFDVSREEMLETLDTVWSAGALDVEPAAVGQMVQLHRG